MSGPEKTYELKIRRYLDDIGAWHLKTYSNGVQRAGVPDILACVNGRFFAIEVKSETGRVSRLQKWNIQRIREAGGIGIVSKPSQWNELKDWIDRLLQVKE